MDTPSRRRTAEFPRPETGLAEWTNRIKELQREVDADEEVEQRRLEEEIRQSRIARKRRSTGPLPGGINVGRSPSPPGGDDMQRNSQDLRGLQDRARGQADALQKLVGATSPSSTMPTASFGRPEPVSLASVIGGKATGPRLKKHAPQQDAMDPTQFEQRTNISNPHPIFGSGGVAMPGLVGKPSTNKSMPVVSNSGADRLDVGKSDRSWIRERTTSSPSSVVSQNSFVTRQSPAAPPSNELRPNAPVFRRQSATNLREPVPERSSSRPDSHRRQDSRERPSSSLSSHSPAVTPSLRPTTPAQNLAKPQPVTPSLARPITPQARATPTGAPQIPTSTNPSPAFLKPAQQKDLTPSLSRLQGRGFVQSMAKLSNELEAASVVGSSSPERGPKKSVLDRWPPSQASPQASPSPSPLRAVPMRKAMTIDSPSSPTHQPLQSVQRIPPKHSTSLPESAHRKSIDASRDKSAERSAVDPVSVPGSSNTLISFVKPTKTGDDPQTDRPVAEHRTGREVDELGVRKRKSVSDLGQRTKAKSEVSAVAPARPLSHPTKDRARRPRKGASTSFHESVVDEVSSEPIVDKSISESPAPITPSLVLSSSPPPQQHHAPAQGSNVRRLQESWANQAPIGVKQVRRSSSERPPPPVAAKPVRHALPGMVPMISPAPMSVVTPPPTLPLTPPLTVNKSPEPPLSPSVLSRRGSTSRPTVMDVAQALNEKSQEGSTSPPNQLKPQQSSVPPAVPKKPTSPSPPPSKPSAADPGGWEKTVTPAMIQAERRKANAEKYSSIVMPVLTEVKTPEQSPANTVTKADAEPSKKGSGLKPVTGNDTLPAVDVAKLLASSVHPPTPTGIKTVSVEMLSVVGSNTTTVTGNILYDSENIVIIHRSKSLQSGLATTKVWNWKGKDCKSGDVEERKIRELATRFGTAAVPCYQFGEPDELVRVLGGTLITRAGKRTLWSSDNTTMHIVRSWREHTIIDEVELNVSKLCSGYSACISVLEIVWVWHGTGSTPQQREHATKYAKALTAGTNKQLEEVEEGHEDESIWMFLGREAFAHADYWRFRRTTTEKDVDPRIWRVDHAVAPEPVKELAAFPYVYDDSAVYILDLVYEVFVLLGKRSDRSNGLLSLDVAKGISSIVAKSRPFPPPVHVLLLPSRIPLDLLSAVRGLEATLLLGGDFPEFMNIMTLQEASDHLRSSA